MIFYIYIYTLMKKHLGPKEYFEVILMDSK